MSWRPVGGTQCFCGFPIPGLSDQEQQVQSMCSPFQPGSHNNLWLHDIYVVVSVPQWGQMGMTVPGNTLLGPELPLLTSRLSSLDDWKQPQLETTLAVTHNL